MTAGHTRRATAHRHGHEVPGPGAGSLSAFGFHTCTDPFADAPGPGIPLGAGQRGPS